MTAHLRPDPLTMEPATFLDHKKVDWKHVRRMHYWMYQRFRYVYPGPVTDMRQRLIVVPPQQRGDQYLVGHRLNVTSPTVRLYTSIDGFGNRIHNGHIPRVEQQVDFEVWTRIERGTHPEAVLRLTAAEAARYLAPTHLTHAAPQIENIARDLAAHAHSPRDLAERISEWTANQMRYSHGVTGVRTTAAEALAHGAGLCQDYSHIMIAVCRAAGLPARYVSGHLLGEGGSHAWVEVLLPDGHGGRNPEAYDPTNRCRAGYNYITIAVGRDYSDVAPTTGSYTAPYQGYLVSSKRAGLIAVDYK